MTRSPLGSRRLGDCVVLRKCYGGRGHMRVARVQGRGAQARHGEGLELSEPTGEVFGATYQQPGSPSEPLEGRLEE